MLRSIVGRVLFDERGFLSRPSISRLCQYLRLGLLQRSRFDSTYTTDVLASATCPIFGSRGGRLRFPYSTASSSYLRAISAMYS